MTEQVIKILVIDDHPLIQDAIRGVLDRAVPPATVLSAESLEAAQCYLDAPGSAALVLLDLSLPGHYHLSALWTLRERHPDVPVAVFSATCDQATIQAALASGARGYLPKHSQPALIQHALRLMLDGGVYVPVDALSATPQASAAQAPGGRVDLDALPPRQREIAELVGRGLSNKEICRELDLSPNTVKTHLAILFDSLKVRSRYEIVAMLHAQRASAGLPGPSQQPQPLLRPSLRLLS